MRPDTISNKCVIAEEIAIEGNVTSQGDLLVRGKITGNINSKDIAIDRGGEVSGDVNGNEVVVKGQVQGNIFGTRVSINAGGVVFGDITSEALAIERGASFVGAAHPTAPMQLSADYIRTKLVERAPKLRKSD